MSLLIVIFSIELILISMPGSLAAAVTFEIDFRADQACAGNGVMNSLAKGDNSTFYAVGICGYRSLWVYKYKSHAPLRSFIIPDDLYYSPISVCMDDDNIIVAGDAIIERDYIDNNLDTLMISKFTPDGALLWEWHLESKYGYIYTSKVKKMANGNYAVTGWYSSYWHIVMTSYVPEMLWKAENIDSKYGDGLADFEEKSDKSVSYTHLTLPTICSV
eukprot:TRINITY_DN5404_c0_g1_i2.p1 TRINITY_DN5404_c0_g1~~TRINITY_DN5404_c0_g1_i2.p1  ORF type:complete len:253 (-),score=-8.07 TRINITY_DN5404_c0_g1_i2:39-689(-)